MVVCRPHNPTGTVEPAADIERFLQVPTDMVVLVDEAHVEFLSPEHRIDGPDLVERYPNVVVLRTFSKAYGLAGLRVGYGFCAPDLACRLWTMQLPFGIGITGMVAVAASYDAENELRQRIRMISAEWRYLRMRLRSMGIYSTDSHANFVYLPARGRPWREVSTAPGCRCATTPTAACGSRSATGSQPGGAVRGGAMAPALTIASARQGERMKRRPRNRRHRRRPTRSRWPGTTGAFRLG